MGREDDQRDRDRHGEDDQRERRGGEDKSERDPGRRSDGEWPDRTIQKRGKEPNYPGEQSDDT